MILKRRFLYFLILNASIGFSMQLPPQKYSQVAPQKKSTWQAAQTDDFKTLDELLKKNPEWVEGKDRNGLTPLAWAVIKDNFGIIRWLIDKKNADVNSKDNNEEPILHKAVRSRNIRTVQYLLDHGAKKSINITNNKGRTPLAEALRASKDGIIHLGIEEADLPIQKEFLAALREALTELATKESTRLSHAELIELINLLIRNGAHKNPMDATGLTTDYYINEVQLVSEPERSALLRAIGAPEKPRIIQDNEKNLPAAIKLLKSLSDNYLKKFTSKIDNLIWTIQEAQKESNCTRKYNLLRIAMGLLSKIKELIHNDTGISQPAIKNIEPDLDFVRTSLRDTALIISGKVASPIALVKPAHVTPQPAKPAALSSTLITKIKQAINNFEWNYAMQELEKLPVIPSELVNYNDPEGETPLAYASKKGNYDLVKKLLDGGADKNKQDSGGFTPLIQAISHNKESVVNLLLKWEANPHIVTTFYGNAVTEAVSTGNITILRTLLELKVDPNQPNKIGKVIFPLQDARRNDRKDLVDLLLKYGAKEKQ